MTPWERERDMQIEREREKERRPSLQTGGWVAHAERSVNRLDERPIWSGSMTPEVTCTRVSGVCHAGVYTHGRGAKHVCNF